MLTYVKIGSTTLAGSKIILCKKLACFSIFHQNFSFKFAMKKNFESVLAVFLTSCTDFFTADFHFVQREIREYIHVDLWL